MLRLEFLQNLEQIKLTASGKLKKFLSTYILNKEKWKEENVAKEPLTVDILNRFEQSFQNNKDIHQQEKPEVLKSIDELIMRAKITLFLNEIDKVQAVNHHVKFQAFLDLYRDAQKTGKQLMLIQQLPQPLLESLININQIEKLKEGLQGVDLHADQQINRFKLACLLEFHIRDRNSPNKSTYTSSGLAGWVVAPVASYLPGMGLFGYHDKNAKVDSAKKFQESIIKEGSWRAILAGAEKPMTEGKSKLFYDVVTNLANFHEPNPEVSYQDSLLGTHASRTPSPSRS